MTTISSKYLYANSANSSVYEVTFPGNIHLNRQALGFLRRSSDAYKNGDERTGRSVFVDCGIKAPELGGLTFFFLYTIHRRPEGDPDYGVHAFFNQYGKSATNSERFQAIDLTLSLVAQYEQSLILQEAQRLHAKAYEGSWEQWWNDNKDTIATAAAVGGAVLTIGGVLFSLIRGGSAPADRVTIPVDKLAGFLPGHVVVGGGHMDEPLQKLATMFGQMQNQFSQPVAINPHNFVPGHVIVGGGHMDSIQQKFASQIKEFMSYARQPNPSSEQYQIVLCKKKHKQSNDNNNNNNNAATTQERGHVNGGVQVNQDGNGNLYVVGGITGDVNINENLDVRVNGNVWVNQDGTRGGGAGVSIVWHW